MNNKTTRLSKGILTGIGRRITSGQPAGFGARSKLSRGYTDAPPLRCGDLRSEVALNRSSFFQKSPTASMASWYALSSIGHYPFCPGSPEYIVTSPVFQRVLCS